MGVGILLVDKVGVVGADEFNVQFSCKLDQSIINQALFLIGFMIGPSHCGLVALQFKIIVVTKHTLEPLDGLARLVHLSSHDELRYLATQAGRAANQPLVVLLQLAVVGTGVVIHALGPGVGHNLDEVFVPLQVLGQQDQVVAIVALVDAVVTRLVGNINLAAKDGRELLALRALLVQLAHIVVKLLDAKHVAMVGDGHAAHAVGYSLVNQGLDRCLPVKD